MITLGSAKRNIVETGRVQVSTRTKIVHGKYNENNLEHDIALLKLPSPINISGKIIHQLFTAELLIHLRCLQAHSLTQSGCRELLTPP
jgi:Trypsin